MPCLSIRLCQDRNSATDRLERWQASSRVRRPARTAVTTSALRRITHRLVDGGGRSSRLSGFPAGPMMLLGLPELSEYIERIPSLISTLQSRKIGRASGRERVCQYG